MNCSQSFGNILSEKLRQILLANDASSIIVNKAFLYNLLLSLNKQKYLQYNFFIILNTYISNVPYIKCCVNEINGSVT